MSITVEMMKKVMTPFIHGYQYVDELQLCVDRMNALGFNDKGLAMLVAQCGHESAGFRKLEEGLSYSVESLIRVWPRRFPDEATAAPYARNPRALAIRTYGGRLGNRPGTEDGWTYRGRGFIQLTGRENYMIYNAIVEADDLIADPESAKDPLAAWEIAIAYFDLTLRRGQDIIEYSNKGDVATATRMINGGTHGMKDRKRRYKLALAAIHGDSVEVTAVIRKGDKGEGVMQLQRLLGITPDGDFGPGTERAVIEFQRKNDLTADGIVGPMTWEDLRD